MAERDVPSSSDEMAATSEVVEEVLRYLDRCGSVAVQSLGVLSGSVSCSDAVVLSALESLRGLSEERLDAVCAEEAAAFEMLHYRLSRMASCVGDEVVSVCMAVHTVICRNGNALCGSERMAELVRDTGELCVRWLERLSSGVDDFCAGSAIYALYGLVGMECATKLRPVDRVPVERAAVARMDQVHLDGVGGIIAHDQAVHVVVRSVAPVHVQDWTGRRFLSVDREDRHHQKQKHQQGTPLHDWTLAGSLKRVGG